MNCYPLVSLTLLTYNQEDYIQEAIESALAQDYENLEIIISDDCSDDKTWERIQRTISGYTGPHRIILNQNNTNIGLLGNIQKAKEMSKSKWITVLAGDDVAYPDRVRHIQSFISSHEDIYAIGTGYKIIDKKGNVIGLGMPNMTTQRRLCDSIITGATAAYHTGCFDSFQPPNSSTCLEDVIYPFRALILGRVLLTKRPTICYRFTEHNVSKGMYDTSKQSLRRAITMKSNYTFAFKQRILDISSTTAISSQLKEKLIGLHKEYIKEQCKEEIEYCKLLSRCQYNVVKSIYCIVMYRIDGVIRNPIRLKFQLILRQCKLIVWIYNQMRIILSVFSRSNICAIHNTDDNQIVLSLSEICES